MSNSPIEKIVQGTGFVALIIKGGKMQYVIPVVPGSVGEQQLAALSSPTLTNPTPVPDGWPDLRLTPADDISKALQLAAPSYSLRLAPGRYRQTITFPPDTTAWDFLSSSATDALILHDFEVPAPK